MLKKSSQRFKIFNDLQRNIVTSSEWEATSRSILQFLQKRLRAQAVFLAFWDPQNRSDENPMFSGKPLPVDVMENLQKSAAGKTPLSPRGLGKDFILRRIVLRGNTLGWIGAMAARDRAGFSLLCDCLKKDFFFLKELRTLRRRLASLNTIYEVSQAVSETLNLDKLLESIMDTATHLMRAQASALGLTDTATQEILFAVAKGKHEETIRQSRMKAGQGIIGTVINTGKPLVIKDAQKDKRFFRAMDEKTGFVTRSVLCVPMKVRNNVIGALEVINPTDQTAFTADQIPVLYTLAQEAAVSIENTRLFQLATTDGLTGLATIRYFRTLLDYELSRAKRYDRALSLILLDIDFFKKINDNHGHLAGDFILKELAKIIRSSIRQMDVAARYGGEEFIVFLPEASTSDALAVAQRIRHTVENTAMHDGSHAHSITVSLGVATMQAGEESNTLIQRADKKMYEAKQSGRNKVCY